MSPINRKELQNYSHLELLARQVVEGFITGLHKSPFHGFSVEFAEHRLYNTGESTRHVDWKLYAKTDKLFVKRYEEETNLRCRLIIDGSSSMFFPKNPEKGKHNKFEFSCYAAAALIELLKRQRDAFGLSLFSDQIDFHSQTKSNTSHQQLIYSELENVLDQPNELKKTSAVDALHLLSDRIHQRSLVVIFSDMFDNSDREDEVLSSLQHLKHNKHEVLLFHVMDYQKELEFDFENKPHRFIDMESGEEVRINPYTVKEEYVKQMQERTKDLKLKCGQYGIDFIEADVNKGFHEVLMPFLVKRKKLY